MTMRKGLQIFLTLFGVIAIVIASLHIAFGPSAIPDSVPVNATMDSEDRFYATLFAAYGVALLWCVKDIEQKSPFVYFLLATFFVAGLARVISIAAVGLPHPFFIAMLALELVIPIVLGFVQYRVSKLQGEPMPSRTRCGTANRSRQSASSTIRRKCRETMRWTMSRPRSL